MGASGTSLENLLLVMQDFRNLLVLIGPQVLATKSAHFDMQAY